MTEVQVQHYLMCLAYTPLGEFPLLFDVGDSICSNIPIPRHCANAIMIIPGNTGLVDG